MNGNGLMFKTGAPNGGGVGGSGSNYHGQENVFFAMERELTNELFYCLNGTSTKHLKYENGGFVISPNVDRQLAETLSKIIPLCNHYKSLEDYVQRYFTANSQPNSQACAHTVHGIIKEYMDFVGQLEREHRQQYMSMHRIWHAVQPMHLRMKFTHKVITMLGINKIDDSGIFFYLSGQLNKLQVDSEEYKILLGFVEHLSTRFLNYLEKWIYEGILYEGAQDFMITKTQGAAQPLDGTISGPSASGHASAGDSASSYDISRAWDRLYQINPDSTPFFLREHSRKILLTGKYLNIMRRYDTTAYTLTGNPGGGIGAAASGLSPHLSVVSSSDATAAAACKGSFAHGNPLAGYLQKKIPFSVNSEHYYSYIEDVYQQASHAILSYVLRQGDFIRQIKLINSLYLGKHVDFVDDYMHQFERDLTLEKQAISVSKLQQNLFLLLNTSRRGVAEPSHYLQTSSGISLLNPLFGHDPKLQQVSLMDNFYKRLSVKKYSMNVYHQILQLLKTSDEHIAYFKEYATVDKCHDLFSFDSYIAWPLSLVVTGKVMDKYNLLFRHFLFLKKVQHRLVTLIYFRPRITTGQSSESMKSSEAHVLLSLSDKIRTKLVVFMEGMLSYFQYDAVDFSLNEFYPGMAKAHTLDDLNRCVSHFQDTCLKRSFLTNTGLLTAMYRIFSLAEVFAQIVQTLTLASTSDETLLSTLEKLGSLVDQEIKQFMAHLSDLSDIELDLFGSNLTLKTNFNAYFQV